MPPTPQPQPFPLCTQHSLPPCPYRFPYCLQHALALCPVLYTTLYIPCTFLASRPSAPFTPYCDYWLVGWDLGWVQTPSRFCQRDLPLPFPAPIVAPALYVPYYYLTQPYTLPYLALPVGYCPAPFSPTLCLVTHNPLYGHDTHARTLRFRVCRVLRFVLCLVGCFGYFIFI